MVKASAYGSGSYEVARLLESQKVDYLGVAYADEGVELREAGIQTPILVLNSEEAVFQNMLTYDLEPEIYSLRQLKQFINAIPKGTESYPIHLNLETGMNRMGFESHEIAELVNILNQNSKKIHVKSIFSHLAASDGKKHDKFTHKQVEIFQKNYSQIADKIGYKPLQHILNSAGISRLPQYQMDMVRLGIGLYGIDGGSTIQDQLQVVNSLKASISQIKDISHSETVGYNRNGRLPKTGKIATISIGYADGLLRMAGSGNYEVLLHGQKAPIVGNVCMDMCMIDVTQIPQAKEGDSVEIFGEMLPVQALAKCLQTIPYEIFTNISGRVKRVYFQE